MAKRSTGLGALAAAIGVLGLAQAAAEPPSASALDNAEANVCMATSRLRGSVAAAVQDSRQSIPIEQLTGRIDNPVSRAQLQRELDNRVKQAQNDMVETDRRDLIRYQAEYRQLAGREFDTGQCDGPRVRVTHAMREQQQRQVAMNAQTARMAQVLAAARLFPPGYVEKSRQVYGEFVSSYQREHGAPFDPSRCR